MFEVKRVISATCQIGILHEFRLYAESPPMSTSMFNFWTFPSPVKVFLSLGPALFFLSSHPVRAESTNKRMIIPGARAQAVSGAYTAVAADASAGWYNPAGLGFSKGPGVSVSVNNYSRSHKEVKGVSETTNLSENSSSIYPGFAGGHGTAGPFALGWSYFTTEQQNTDESQTFNLSSFDSLGTESNFRYDRIELTTGNLIQAGASIALALTENLSIGVSEFYYRRQKQTSLKERSTYDSGVFYDSFARQSTENEGTIAVAGILLRTQNLSLGIALKSPTALTDKTDYETSSVIFTGSTPELSSATTASHREDELLVRTWSFGAAYTPGSWALLSLDGLHYPATTTAWSDAGGFNTETVTDWSLGLELRSRSLLLAGGAFTNSSLVSTPKPSLIASGPAKIDYLGFSAGMGFRTSQSETMLIMVRQRGKGQTQMVQGSLTLQDVTIETQTFSLSSSYRF